MATRYFRKYRLVNRISLDPGTLALVWQTSQQHFSTISAWTQQHLGKDAWCVLRLGEGYNHRGRKQYDE
jgi:hypothetical protein